MIFPPKRMSAQRPSRVDTVGSASMPSAETNQLQEQVPFLYEMVISLFEAARATLDPVMQAIDGYRELETLKDDRPAAPEHVTRKLAELPSGAFVHHMGACLCAATNLGLAYVHTLRLLSVITQRKDSLPPKAVKPNLVKLHDALPRPVQEELAQIYHEVGSHDFEMKVSAEPLSENLDDPEWPGGDFRAQLANWQSRGILQDSHLSISGRSPIRLFIPLRSALILDRIIADQIAPKLGRDYKTMDGQMSSRTENPQLVWDGEMISVSLPDKLGRVLEAKWNPTITSVVRIRESGASEWGPGFETPFNMCSFVDLKPDMEYDVQVTHKNDAGEGEPTITTMKTHPQRD